MFEKSTDILDLNFISYIKLTMVDLTTMYTLILTPSQVSIGNSSLVALPGSFSNAPKATPTVPILLIIVVASSAGGELVAMATICLFCLCTKNIIGFRRKKSTDEHGRDDFTAKSRMNSRVSYSHFNHV